MKKLILLWLVFVYAGTAATQEKVWSSRFELSYVSTSGNTKTQAFSGKVEVKGEKGANRFLFHAGYLNSRDDGEDNVNRLNSNLRYERVFTGRLFGFVGTGYLRDRFAGYAHRISGGPGVGVDVLKGETHTLKGLVSSEYVYESFAAPAVGSDDYASAKAAMNYGWKIRENVAYAAAVNAAFSLEHSEKYFVNAVTSLGVSVSRSISVGISYTVNYQNMVPNPDIEKTDTSFLTSLIIDL